MPTVDAEVGGANANSFVSIDRAWEIIDTLPWQGNWPTRTAATVALGSGTDGTVTVTAAEPGVAGNDFTAEVVLAVGASQLMSVALIADALTVTLGTKADTTADPAKNTAALVAIAVNALPEFAAVASGTGAGVIAVTALRPFTGGDDADDAVARLLIQATRWIRAKTCWTGSPASTTQALPWPRTGMLDGNGNAIPANVIPEDLKVATVTLAVLLAKEDVTAGNEIALQGITKVKAGPVELNFKDDIAVSALPGSVSGLFPASWLCPVADPAAVRFMFAMT